jgi:N-acetylmuramidase/Putative peptidoglycan binding domain
MVTAMAVSENHQLLGLAGEITHTKLDRVLRRHDRATFARGYNGPADVRNSYDTRLAAAYQKFTLRALPDLFIRTAQLYLTYLGYHPGPIDGMLGRLTRSAVNEFQEQQRLPVTSDVTEEQLVLLKQAVEKLEA